MITKNVKSSLVAKLNSLDTFEVKPFAKPTFDPSKVSEEGYLESYAVELVNAKNEHEKTSGAPSEMTQTRFACASLFASLFPSTGSLDDKEFGEQMSLFRATVINRIGIHHLTETEFASLMILSLRDTGKGLGKDRATHFLSFLSKVENRETERNFSAEYKAHRLTLSMANVLVSGLKVQNLEAGDKAKMEESTLDIVEALTAISKDITPYKVVPAPTPKTPAPTGKTPAKK